jgi:acyl-CoA thioesterase
MTPLEEALSLSATGEGEWLGMADPRYEAGTGMFGGWTAAVLLRSVTNDPRAQGSAATLTVHYLKRIVPGQAFRIRTRQLGGSRSLAFFQAELTQEGDEQVAAQATVLVAQRKSTDGFTEQAMPSAPDPSTLPEVRPPAPFGERTPQRIVSPQGLFDQPSSRSITWVRETSGRTIDRVQLAYLADAYAPRILFKSKGPRLSTTITMSVYFHATDDELRALGDDLVLTDCVGTRAEHGTIGSKASLWSRGGKLLATTEQLCWFK